MKQAFVDWLTSHQNPRQAAYQKLWRQQQFCRTGSEGTAPWRKLSSPIYDPEIDGTPEQIATERNYFKQHLADEILIDLGSGFSAKNILIFANSNKVKTYIPADLYHEQPCEPKLFWHTPSDENSPETYHIQADMLDFIARVPSKSASITMNAIDSEIVPGTDYHNALKEEIVRVVKPGGLIFGGGSVPLDILAAEVRGGERPELAEHEIQVKLCFGMQDVYAFERATE